MTQGNREPVRGRDSPEQVASLQAALLPAQGSLLTDPKMLCTRRRAPPGWRRRTPMPPGPCRALDTAREPWAPGNKDEKPHVPWFLPRGLRTQPPVHTQASSGFAFPTPSRGARGSREGTPAPSSAATPCRA